MDQTFCLLLLTLSQKFLIADGPVSVHNKDGNEAICWTEEVDNPYRTQIFTSLQQWRTHQLIFEPGARDPEKVDVVMTELESNLAR